MITITDTLVTEEIATSNVYTTVTCATKHLTAFQTIESSFT